MTLTIELVDRILVDHVRHVNPLDAALTQIQRYAYDVLGHREYGQRKDTLLRVYQLHCTQGAPWPSWLYHAVNIAEIYNALPEAKREHVIHLWAIGMGMDTVQFQQMLDAYVTDDQ
jgi:hypothetical protein